MLERVVIYYSLTMTGCRGGRQTCNGRFPNQLTSGSRISNGLRVWQDVRDVPHPREPMGMFVIRRPENFSALFCAYDCGGQSRGNFSFDDIDERATTNG